MASLHRIRARWVGRAALTLILATAALAAATASAAAAVAPAQLAATLAANHTIYSYPNGRSEAVISRHRPITGEATTLPVLSIRQGRHNKWLLVRLPGRLLPGSPNGRTGWIKAVHTRLWTIRWRIFVSLGQRTARIYLAGRLVRQWLVVVGAPTTPTPTGQFFVEENVEEPPSFAGSPFALATSARSNVFTEFDGGPGQVALHGVGGGLGGTPGQAQSHGCVRFENADITWLAARIYPGTPVTITR
jgi:lipoprotein-anchoring transpeptidase ErfK/SrfK